MIVLTGAELVLPDRIQSPGTLLLDGDRIVEVIAGTQQRSMGSVSDDYVDLHDHYIVPGFIDVHVHGVERTDSLDGPPAVGQMASRLPKYGVTAFCPTTVACAPDALRQVLTGVREMKAASSPSGSRVLSAHLESNFINPAFRGAQPEHCLRSPRARDERGATASDDDTAGAPRIVVADPAAARTQRLLAYGTGFVYVFGLGTVLAFLPAYAADRGLSPRAVGLLLGAYWVARLMGSLGAGRLSDRLGRRAGALPRRAAAGDPA